MSLLLRAQILYKGAPSAWPNHLPKPLSPSTIPWGLGYQLRDFEGTQTFSPEQRLSKDVGTGCLFGRRQWRPGWRSADPDQVSRAEPTNDVSLDRQPRTWLVL